MSSLKLFTAEIAYRPLNFLLCLTAIAVAATLFVAGPLVLNAYVANTQTQLAEVEDKTKDTLKKLDKQTKRIMRDIGVNLRIVHKDTNFGDLYTDYKAVDFPESDVHELAKTPGIDTIVHLVATINEKIMWNDRVALLVGMMPVMTVSQKNEEKPHMVKDVEPGTVHVGHLLGKGLSKGGTLEILGREFKIAAVMPSKGTQEDVQLIIHLEDAQQLLDKEGRVHQILALSCKCKGERISIIQKQLETSLPHVKVTEMESRASAREKQRDLVTQKSDEQLGLIKSNRAISEASLRQFVRVVSPLVVGVCALFVGLLTWLNVRERRNEIGVLRAIGKGSSKIALLILGKAALIGLLGGALGAVLGVIGAAAWSPHVDFSMLSDPSIRWVLIATVVGSPLVAVVASYLPMLMALVQDPSIVLSDG